MSPSILFLCLARDCAETLPAFFRFLAALGEQGISAAAWIGENGSSDGTGRLIDEAAGLGVERVDTSAMAAASERLERMAIGRQLLLDRLRASTMRPRVVCVADLDSVMAAPPEPERLTAAMAELEQDAGLFAVGASSRPYYYDLLAFRHEEFGFLRDLHVRIQKAKRNPLTYYHFQATEMYAVQRRVTARVPLRCASSFNGLCLYRGEDYLRGTYRAADEREVCEHVTFNLAVAASTGRQMRVSDGLVLAMPADHAPVGFVRFWRDRVRKALR